MEWISVKDRLPENGQSVLAARPDFRGGQYVCIEVYCGEGGRYVEGFYLEGEMDTNLTHWMPVPAPPCK